MEELYNSLFEAGDYTGSFEDFKEQFGSEEKSKVLYKALNDNGEYTKSIDEFNTQFGFSSAEDFPTDDVPSAVAESQEGEIALTDQEIEDTESDSVDTSSELQEDDEPLSSWQSIKNSFSNLGEQVGDIFEFWLDTEGDGGGARASLDIATNAVWSAMFGQESVDAYVKEKGKDSYMAQGIGSESTIESIKKFEKEKLESKQTKGVIESVEKGDIGGVIAGTINSLTSAVGSVGFGVSTVGAGFLSEYIAENYVEFNKLKAKNLGVTSEELIKSGKADTAIPIGMGVVSSGLEYIGIGAVLKGVKGASKGTAGSGSLIGKASKYIAEKAIYNKNARAVLGALGTGSTEFTTEILQHAADEINKEFGSVAGTDNEAQIAKAFIDAVTSREGLEAGVQGFLGGTGLTTGTYSAKAMNTIRTVTDARSVDDKIQKLNETRQRYNKSEDKVVKEGIQKEIDKLDSEIADSVRNGNKIYNSLDEGQISEIESLTDLAEAAAYKVTELNKKVRRNEISEEAYESAKSGFTAEYKEARQKLLDMQLDKNIKFAEEEASKRGVDFVSLKNQKEFNKAVLEAENLSDKGRQEFKDLKGRVHGVSIGNKIFINKEFAREEGAINVGSHELLHPILNKLIGGVKDQKRIVNQFRRSMTSSQRRFVDKQMKKRNYTGDKYYTEYITVFSDALREKQINYDKTTFEKIGDVLVGLFKPKGYENISFESGKDVYNFIKEYDQSTDKGSLTLKAEEAIKDVDLSDASLSEDGKKQDSNLSKSMEDLQQELDTLEENEFDYDPGDFENKRSNLQYKITQAKKAPVKKPVVKKEKAEKEETTKKTYDNEALVETIKSKETTRKDKAAAESELVESFDTMALKAIKYDTRKGDLDRTEVRDYLRQFLPKIIESYKPDESKFSTWVYNNIAPKAQQTYEKFKKIADKSLDVKAGEVGSVVEIASEVSKTPVETTKKPSRKIKPIELIRDPKLEQKYRDAIKKAVESGDVDIEKGTFGKMKDLAAEVTSEIFDIPLLKVTDPADNLAFKDTLVDDKNLEEVKKYYPEAKVGMIIKSESSKIQDIIKSMGPDLFKLMPPSNAAPELATVDAEAYKGVKGTGLKIPTSLMKAFYEATGKRSKGVTSQVVIKELKKDLTYEKFLEELGIKKGEANKYDRKIGQRLKAITTLFGKLATNTEIRQLEGVTDVQKQNIGSGRSDIQFSKISNAYKTTTNKEANIDFNDKQKVSKFKKDIFDVFDNFSEDDFLNYILPTASKGYNYKWKTVNGKKVYSEDFKNVRNVVFEGRVDFFESYNEHRKKKGLKQITHKKGDRSVEYTDINGNIKKTKLSILKKQSSEGVNSGKFFETIKERINIAKDQRKGLKKILKALRKYNENNPDDKTFIPMLFTMMNSNTDSLIRTAAIPKWIMYVNGLSDSDYVYEHPQTASDTSVELIKAIYNSKTDAEFDAMFDKIMKNFDVAIIPKDQDSIVNKTMRMNGPRKGGSKGDYSLELIYPEEKGFPVRYKYANENNGANISLTPIIDFSKSSNVKNIKELSKSTIQASKSNNDMLPKSKRLKGDFTMDQVLDEMKRLDDQQTEAGIQFSNGQNLDKDFNDILEKKSGIASDKEYKRVKAETVGASKGRFKFFIPPSAEDFVGLLYATLGKGKTGDAQMAWYKKNLLNPFARAMENISRDRNALGRDFRELKKKLKIVPKDLKKKVPGDVFTKEQAVRVWIWDQIGEKVPGLDDSDIKELIDYVNSNPDLKTFGTEIMKLNKGTGYVSPTDSWNTGTITTDLLETLNTTKRKKYLELWQQNVDIIFSEKNLNKLEAIYGKQYRKAMENMLKRMKTGRNRSTGTDSLTTRVTDWLTGSIGAIMFFNTRSAVLQTLSAVNFINFGDNNILAAGKAFANQKQYWTDFKKLFNSEFLIERRDGLKMNVNEADIADIAKERGVRGVINKLLKLGFTPTQIADSFAIASGGATFYRNRVKSLMKQGKSSMAAEREALRDFREIAEESQQSSRPDKISQQQAGPLGRIILAFANTPAQYARLIKKAASDLKNGRGDAKTNISKIIYYGVAQNLVFNALQQALFAVAFGEDEEEDEKKVVDVANGMIDGILRGTGIGGAVFSVIKNAGIKLAKENAKDNPKYENAASELLKLSPPISSKIGKVKAALRSYSWDKEEMKEKGFSLDNPAYLAGANVVSATTNVPLDRVIKKINNVTASTQENISVAQRIALLSGWSEWQLGIKKSKKPKSRKNVRGKSSKRRVLN